MPSPLAGTAVQLLAGGLGLLIISATVGEQPTPPSPHSLAALAYLIAVDSLAGFALCNWLLRNAPVTPVSTYAYAVPVIACAVGVIRLGEPFHPLAMLGAAAIVAAIASELSAKKVDPR